VWLLAAVLVLVTIALYWPTTSHDFINFDDPDYVTANPHVQGGLSIEGMKWAVSNPVCGNWHPLTVWSHMLDCQVFGLKPGGHHVTNVLLHALNAALVLVWLQQMTGARWRSLWVAALFAVHPLRVEPVLWVTERREVLCACFGLLTLMAYVRYAKGKSEARRPKSEGNPKPEGRNPKSEVRGRWSFSHLPASSFYLLSLGFFACGLMSKAMLVTWPFVMLLLDYWPLGRMMNDECRMQNAEANDTQHATRNTQHVSHATPQSPIAHRPSPIAHNP
jgi:hypothetical protein